MREFRSISPKVLQCAAAVFLLSFPVFANSSASAQTVTPLKMVLVQGGTFWQGSQEAPYANNERFHKTALSTFKISSTEVTQELYQSVMGKNPSRFKGAQRPVEMVSWYDAVRFCNALSERLGLRSAYEISGSTVTWDRSANGFRLPTEAEWEYAARGGMEGAIEDEPLRVAPYAGGTEANRVAWYETNSEKSTKPVGTKEPNQLGLYDMSGNVWEWCWDWYGSYPTGETTDPEGASSDSWQKVLRGGSWFVSPNLLRVTYRYWNNPDFKVNSVGFRIAQNAEEPAPVAPSVPVTQGTSGPSIQGPAAPPTTGSAPERNGDLKHVLPDGIGLDEYDILSAPKNRAH